MCEREKMCRQKKNDDQVAEKNSESREMRSLLCGSYTCRL